MRQDPFPSPEWDGEEPGGVLPPGGPRQEGLFISVPAGELDADRFAQLGPAPDLPPGPLLATVVDTVAGQDGGGLAGLSDDQLIGVITAVRRLESRVAWYSMAAVREFADRHTGQGADEFAAEELAAGLHLTGASAAGQMDYASTVTGRLPATFAALHAGTIHPVHARIIEDETRVLSGEDAAKADEILAGVAGSLTFGRLRSAAHRLVLELDPDAARKRKEAARQDAHVRRFREDSGNAGMVARELPPDEVLASWQHVEQRALDLRAAGVPGTLQELRVRAYLDLLQERDSRDEPEQVGGPQNARNGDAPDGTAGPGCGLGGNENSGPGGTGGPGHGPADGNGGPGGNGDPGRDPSGGTGGSGRGCQPGQDRGPSLAALVNITVPWSALQGESEIPADMAGFGLVDAQDARNLAAAAARDPRTRWCVTALHPDGTAAAHGCIPGRHPPPGTRDLAVPGPDPPAGIRPRDYLRQARIQMTPIACGGCGHHHAEPGYRPSRKLQHLVKIRNARCTAPGCGRPAVRCDLDHTVAWDQGGLTCECDLAPLCRHHHRCKQAEGWQLTQPEPGVLVWRTPSGRSYSTMPTVYPV
jgi:Domain of unknown function (DUF222)